MGVELDDESYEIKIRIEVRRDGKRVAPDGLMAFDVGQWADPRKLVEVAADAAKLAAVGGVGPKAVTARLRQAVRDTARRSDVQRGVAIVGEAMRQGAQALERKTAQVAARIIVDDLSGED